MSDVDCGCVSSGIGSGTRTGVAPDGTAEHSAVRLQYRALLPNVDASGAFCPPGVWSEWRDVPTVTESEATCQDAA